MAARSVGQLVRDWRQARGMSQLDLALHAGFSARHVSFIETGRAQPIALAESLDVPLRERNRLLQAGGYAHVYRETPLAAADMRHVRGVLQFILDRHEPYGAIVLDRHSTCLMANGAATQLLSAVVDPSLMSERGNLLRMVFHPLGARRFIVNWDQVARHLIERAEREIGAADADSSGAALLAELRGYGVPDVARTPPVHAADLLLPIHIDVGGIELRLFSTVMTLGTPQDVTLQELRVETFFPADADSERTWRAMGSSPAGSGG